MQTSIAKAPSIQFAECGSARLRRTRLRTRDNDTYSALLAAARSLPAIRRSTRRHITTLAPTMVPCPRGSRTPTFPLERSTRARCTAKCAKSVQAIVRSAAWRSSPRCRPSRRTIARSAKYGRGSGSRLHSHYPWSALRCCLTCWICMSPKRAPKCCVVRSCCCRRR